MRAMKDSGIEWIGEIPQDWEISRIKHSFDAVLGKMLQPTAKNESDLLLPYMCSANITWSGIDLSVEKAMWFSEAEKENYLLKRGDLLVTEGGDVAVSCIWRDELPVCCIQNAVHRVRPRRDADNRFLYYWMSTLKNYGYIDMVCNKATLAHFTKEKLDNCVFIIPPAYIQNKIADYLDTKCAEIDDLIAAKEKTNTLLKERRQSLIYEAVTKGLNPTVHMKDSGIEWLDVIPEQWNVASLKRLGTPETGATPSKANSDYWDGTIPWVSSKDMKSDYLMDSEDHITLEAVTETGLKLFPKDTIIFCVRSGILRHTFPVSITTVPVTINQDLRAMVLTEEIDSAFLLYYLRGINDIIIALYQKIGATVESIEMDWLMYLPVLVPSKREQQQIVSHLKEACASIDAAIKANDSTIEKLKEYRQSLIYEAVTGKIEV